MVVIDTAAKKTREFSFDLLVFNNTHTHTQSTFISVVLCDKLSSCILRETEVVFSSLSPLSHLSFLSQYRIYI